MNERIDSNSKRLLIEELDLMGSYVKKLYGSKISYNVTDDNPYDNSLLSLVLELEVIGNDDEKNGMALSVSVLTYDPYDTNFNDI